MGLPSPSFFQRGPRWAWLLAFIAAGLAVAGLVLASLVPSNDDLARRAAAELEARLGVKTTVGTLDWHLLPTPHVVLTQIRIGQPEPITVARATAYPRLRPLLQRHLQLSTLEIDGAVVPQVSLAGLGREPKVPPASEAVPLATLVLRDITWISPRGTELVYALQAEFDPGWRPRQAQLTRSDATPLTRLSLQRIAQQDRWETQVELGGGSANGVIALQTASNGLMQLSGQLETKRIDVVEAMKAFKRRSVVGGLAEGTTTLSARGQTLGEMARSLQTRTRFSMAPATLLRFDLDRAIQSVGAEHAGQTPLDSLTGQLDTANSARGLVVRYTNVEARSGALSAKGAATLANRRIEAEFAVDLVDGLVGVPLTVSGTLDDPKVSVPKAAVAGAVAGTAVLPGIGTAIGARIGAAIGKLFGGGDAIAPLVPPAPPAQKAEPIKP
jgi:uncharacterized protein involved in outer membrane biogenesis